MRIAIDARAYFQRTGIARYTRGLIAALAAHAPPAVRYLVLISNRHEARELPLPAHMTVQVSAAEWLAPNEGEVLDREACAWRADLFQAVFPPLAVASLPSITTVFDVTPFTRPGAHQEVVRTAFGRSWERAVARRSHFVATSLATRAAMRPWLHSDVSVSVVGIGLSPPFDAPEPPLSGLPARRGLLFVGTQEPRKRLDVAVATAMALRGDTDVGPLTVVGKTGWGDPSGTAPGSSRDVVARGFVSDEDLLALYRRSAILLCPSEEEGFGLPVLEGMAQGVLPIVSPDAALLELVEDPRLSAPREGTAMADVVRWWLAHPEEWATTTARLAHAARQRTWARVAADWHAVHRAVAA